MTSSVANRSALGEFANDRAGQIYGPDEQCKMIYGEVSSLDRVRRVHDRVRRVHEHAIESELHTLLRVTIVYTHRETDE